MRQYADIVIFDKSGQLALIAEVKNKLNTTREWASRMRRNMFSHNLLSNAPFFLLALPDVFYVWIDEHTVTDNIEPTLEINPKPFLQPYFKTTGISPNDVSGKSFELIISTWLQQVMTAVHGEDLEKHQEWLVNSGLFDKIAGGHLEIAAAA